MFSAEASRHGPQPPGSDWFWRVTKRPCVCLAQAGYAMLEKQYGSFVTNGYNATISSSFGSPIGGRNAWSGNAGGFLASSVNMPAAATGQNAQLRWRMATDSSVSATGWQIDDVTVTNASTPLTYNAGSNNVTVRVSGTNIELRDTPTNTLLASQDQASTSVIFVNGTGGVDTLTIDQTGGNPFATAGIGLSNIDNIVINGTAGNDTFVARGVAGGLTGFTYNTTTFNGFSGFTSVTFNGGAGRGTTP